MPVEPGAGRVVMGALAPHPPHLVYAENPPQNEPRAECGWEGLRWAYERLRKDIARHEIDVIIVHSPHWKTAQGHHVLSVPQFKGLSVDPIFPNLFRYHYDLRVDIELASAIVAEGRDLGLCVVPMENPEFRVDYGTIISCHMSRPGWDIPIVSISSNRAYFDYSNDVGEQLMIQLGRATRKAVERSGRRALLLASCSLSHRHHTTEAEIPEDMTKEHIYHHGQYLWDMHVLDLMKRGKIRQLMAEMPDFIEQAVAETRDGSLTWLLSALDFPEYPAEVYGYGTVIGTGNAVVGWDPQAGGAR
jgi:2-aminophenol/2-amino-5-chlorophenol 1,6-dioxygenase beta subunit